MRAEGKEGECLLFREKLGDVASEAGAELLDGLEAHVLVADLQAVQGGLRDPELPSEEILRRLSPKLSKSPGQTPGEVSHLREGIMGGYPSHIWEFSAHG